MQKILLLFLIFINISFISYGQKDSSIVEIKKINNPFVSVQNTTKSKDDSYKAIKLWIIKNIQDYKNFIDVDDKDLGIISFKTSSPLYKYHDFHQMAGKL